MRARPEAKRRLDPETLLARESLARRQIFLWGPVEDASARHVIERLLYLSGENSEEEIKLFIQSPGGANVSGMAILDVMHLIPNPVSTICLGMAASFGALLLCVGTAGRRFALPNSRIMIHQPHIMGKVEATPKDLRIQAEEIRKDRERINQIIADRTGRTREEIDRDTDRDFWLSAEEAKAYGLIDDVIRADSTALPF